MTDPTDPHDARLPSAASKRARRFGGEFWGVRYEAAIDIGSLEPGPAGPVAELPGGAGSADPDPRTRRTQVEAWEWEGGAVG